jgi:hypothetical protein
MKKLIVSLVSLAVIAMPSSPAVAIRPFDAAFKKLYVKKGEPLDAEVTEVKCNVCHVKRRNVPNEYGMAVSKYLKKADFIGYAKKYDKIADLEAQKALADGLEKAGAEKAGNGKNFAEILKSGELPGGEE